MDIKTLSTEEAIAAVTALEDIAELRKVATQLGITYSGNTGTSTLKEKILEMLQITDPDGVNDGDLAQSEETGTDLNALLEEGSNDPIQISQVPAKSAGPTLEEMLEMDPFYVEDSALRRKVVRAQAMRLVRIKIVNLDPSDTNIPGALFTAYNKYTGKVTKYIPYGDESHDGYHVPKIILDMLKTKTFPLRKENNRGKNFGVKTYTTSYPSKFSITELPLLTKEELADLAVAQLSAN